MKEMNNLKSLRQTAFGTGSPLHFLILADCYEENGDSVAAEWSRIVARFKLKPDQFFSSGENSYYWHFYWNLYERKELNEESARKCEITYSESKLPDHVKLQLSCYITSLCSFKKCYAKFLFYYRRYQDIFNEETVAIHTGTVQYI